MAKSWISHKAAKFLNGNIRDQRMYFQLLIFFLDFKRVQAKLHIGLKKIWKDNSRIEGKI